MPSVTLRAVLEQIAMTDIIGMSAARLWNFRE
jgi:hypothetical protein